MSSASVAAASPAGPQRLTIELVIRHWWLPISALFLRVGLFAFTQLPELLQDRHELATPFSAYRRRECTRTRAALRTILTLE